jgi:hypothetical protein
LNGEEAVSLSRYFIVLATVWMVAMTWRVYPQFKDTLRIDGRLRSLGEYIEETCGQRIGPAAQSCLTEAQNTGRRLVAREQGKTILLIQAPLLGYLLVYLVRVAIRTALDGLGWHRTSPAERC